MAQLVSKTSARDQVNDARDKLVKLKIKEERH
jgi:hypothetical protein